MRNTILLIPLLVVMASAAETPHQKSTVVVGSKNFTENYILAEVAALLMEKTGLAQVQKKTGFGGTGLLFQALKNGEVDVYPEYTGTISESILKKPFLRNFSDLQEECKKMGLFMSSPLGFNNTYALAVRSDTAKKLNLNRISDLKNHPTLSAAFSYEFMDRADGIKPLLRAYNLRLGSMKGMEHGLAYEALRNKEVDIIDIYSTDAKIEKFNLRVLEDDKQFFPRYDGVFLARREFVENHPELWKELQALGGELSNESMTNLNSLVENNGQTFEQAAKTFLGDEASAAGTYVNTLWRLTGEHLFLVTLSVAAAAAIGIPLGIFACFWKRLGQGILIASGLIQTIPSLALLCFLIPLFGVGVLPSLIALFLYGLLPIVRNTYTGLMSLDKTQSDVGQALGLSRIQILWLIQIPLASPHILSGIKTSSVITVGTATLAALIGAGGYGSLIVTGLALNNIPLILKGALPAAALALIVHGLFEWLDQLFIPKGLRI